MDRINKIDRMGGEVLSRSGTIFSQIIGKRPTRRKDGNTGSSVCRDIRTGSSSRTKPTRKPKTNESGGENDPNYGLTRRVTRRVIVSMGAHRGGGGFPAGAIFHAMK